MLSGERREVRGRCLGAQESTWYHHGESGTSGERRTENVPGRQESPFKEPPCQGHAFGLDLGSQKLLMGTLERGLWSSLKFFEYL